jgi:small subunit ribosomal protein S1
VNNWDRIVGDENGLPEPDEAWWTAILADEGAIEAEKTEINCKPCENSNDDAIDWECVKSIFLKDEVVLLEVYGFNRGGVLVKGSGIQGFVPVSHLIDLPMDASDEEKQRILSGYNSRSLYLKVIECEPVSERIVLSERAAQAGEGTRKQLFNSLTSGMTACGVITNITDFGVFVDLGGVEGLVHVSELSWGRVDRPAHLFHVGEQVKVMILQVSESAARIALSIKRLSPNPWSQMLENYQTGDIVPAVVTSIIGFGVFARLKEGVEGLIHISSIENCNGSRELSRLFSAGQNVQVKSLHIDADRRRLGLGLVSDE